MNILITRNNILFIMLDLNKYDKTLEDLKSHLFSERKLRKLDKLEPNFYKNIHSLLIELDVEKNDMLLKAEIKKYMDITHLIDEIRKNFKAFFQIRFEKIARYSVYDMRDSILENMTPEEKNIIKELSSKIDAYYSDFSGVRQPEEKTEEETEIMDELQTSTAGQEIEVKNKEPQSSKNVIYKLVRIIQDLPPIAQPEKDYYLHKNDVLYLPEDFSEILHRRGSLVFIKNKDNDKDFKQNMNKE